MGVQIVGNVSSWRISVNVDWKDFKFYGKLFSIQRKLCSNKDVSQGSLKNVVLGYGLVYELLGVVRDILLSTMTDGGLIRAGLSTRRIQEQFTISIGRTIITTSKGDIQTITVWGSMGSLRNYTIRTMEIRI